VHPVIVREVLRLDVEFVQRPWRQPDKHLLPVVFVSAFGSVRQHPVLAFLAVLALALAVAIDGI